MNKRILGIDQSYTCSGVVVLEDGEVIHAETVTSDKDDDIFRRAWEISNRIALIAKEHDIDLAVIESLSYGSRGNATRDLAGLQFVLTMVLKFLDDRNCVIAQQSSVKKFAVPDKPKGTGAITKDEMVERLPPKVRYYFDHLGVKKTTGLRDLSDAYWIAKYGEKKFA